MLYYLGMVNLLGVEQILLDGKNAVYTAGTSIFGENGGKLILISVLISLLGVVNGLTIGLLRFPQILAEKGMLGQIFASSFPEKAAQDSFSMKMIYLTLISVAVWTMVHYFVMKYDLFQGGDISEIAIVFSYIIYAVLYVRALQIPISKNPLVQYLIPLFALCGSGMIVIGSLLINRVNVLLFFLFCTLWCGLGYYVQKK